MQALSGEWKLLLTTDVQTQSVVRAISMLPFVSLGDIVQRIDIQQKEVETRVTLSAPIHIDVRTLGTFRLKSSKRAKSTVQHARVISYVETPQLFAGLLVPQSVTVGDTHEIDLSPFLSTANMLQTTVFEAIHFATRHEMQVDNSNSTVWLNTVVRDGVRICRGINSEILVFQRCS